MSERAMQIGLATVIAPAESRSESHAANSADSRLFSVLGDERKVRAVLLRGEGKQWREIAYALGVHESTIRIWRHDHPLEALATDIARDLAHGALIKLTSRLSKAVDVICDHVDGKIDRDDIEAERLRAQAAKTSLGLVVKLIENETAREQGLHASTRKSSTLSTQELITRARELRKLSSGK